MSVEQLFKRNAVDVRSRLMNPANGRLIEIYEHKIARLEEQLEFARTARVQSIEALIANERRANERCNELEAIVEKLQERLRKAFAAVGEITGEVSKRDLLKPEEIIRQVLKDYWPVTVEEIKGVARERYISEARAQCMYRVHKLRPDISFPRLGKIFHRDHSTVMHACRKIALREMEP